MNKEENKLVDIRADQPLTVIWKRLDLPGHESCRVLASEMGWRLSGAAALAADGQACRLDYQIDCDRQWVTQSATVTGWVGNRTIDVRIVRDENGQWYLNEKACAAVAGCLDVDLNFSPSTNFLPIRRLNLSVGERATVQAAWLRFPSFTLESLDQTYTRVEDRLYRYESNAGEFVADVTVDETGLVVEYGQLWLREVPL